MNLEGKYIEIKKTEIIQIMNILHNYGYVWGDPRNIVTLQRSIDAAYVWVEDGKLGISFYAKSYFFRRKIPMDEIKMSIEFLYREVKLKRILK